MRQGNDVVQVKFSSMPLISPQKQMPGKNRAFAAKQASD
jgi:hypothetical protein